MHMRNLFLTSRILSNRIAPRLFFNSGNRLLCEIVVRTIAWLACKMGESREVCQMCYRWTSHKDSPTLTPEFKTNLTVSGQKKCNVCRQRWAPIRIARDGPHGKWIEVRVRPKIAPNIDYQLCKSSQSRTECMKGLECSFAHSKTELAIWNSERQREPRLPPPISGPHQYQLCKHKTNTGLCPYGQRCNFAHTEEELRQWLRMQTGSGRGATESNYTEIPMKQLSCNVCGLTCTSAKQLEDHLAGSRHRQQMVNKPTGKYPPKTPPGNVRQRPTLTFAITEFKMCRHIDVGRRCVYGDYCTFAHTVQELEEWNRQLQTTSRPRVPRRRYLETGQ